MLRNNFKRNNIHTHNVIAFYVNKIAVKEVPLLAILTRNTSSNFFPWVLVNMWVQFLKKLHCYRPVVNGHFITVCTERMMDHQYGENGTRNIYSNNNQMRAYVECSQNQSKIVLYRSFHREIDETLKILEKCWLFLYLNFTRVLQFYQPTLIRWLLYVYK